MTSLLDVVIRAHDPARLDELGRAVFSAALQDHRTVTLHVVCQRFTPAALDAVRATLGPLLALAPEARLNLLNRPDPAPHDARAALLNLGLRAATGRYLAFLDYDDLIYPEGWRLLIEELERSGAAIAFGSVANTQVSRAGLVPLVTAKRTVFQGSGLVQLLHDNFCPLHSYVLDRSRIPPAELVFDETLVALEDYDLLLRIVACHGASFRLKDKRVGEYLLKDDGSNLNPIAAASPDAAWEAASAEMTRRKQTLVLTPSVQAALGIDEPGLTVAAFLARRGTLL